MKRTLKTLVALALATTSVSAFAVDLEIKDQIRSDAFDITNPTGAKDDLAQRCAEWKKEVQDALHGRLIVANCGVANVVRMRTKDKYWFSMYSEGSYQTYEGPYYANLAVSESQIVVATDVQLRSFTSELAGEQYACPKKEVAPCLAARKAALSSFEAQCETWKTDMASQLGARFVWATCGSVSNIGDSDDDKEEPYFNHRMGSTGKVYYLPE
jgi:hypothetical protein